MLGKTFLKMDNKFSAEYYLKLVTQYPVKTVEDHQVIIRVLILIQLLCRFTNLLKYSNLCWSNDIFMYPSKFFFNSIHSVLNCFQFNCFTSFVQSKQGSKIYGNCK